MRAIISINYYFNSGARHSAKGRRHRGKHESFGTHLMETGGENGRK